jgi:hypothetical protein
LCGPLDRDANFERATKVFFSIREVGTCFAVVSCEVIMNAKTIIAAALSTIALTACDPSDFVAPPTPTPPSTSDQLNSHVNPPPPPPPPVNARERR